MSLDPVLQNMMAALAKMNLPAFADGTPGQARELMRALRAARPAPPTPEIGSIEDVTLSGPRGDIPARLYVPFDAPAGLIVWFHGGGWVVGDLDSSHALAQHLVDASGWGVLSVDYRLAPEHPYPAPLDDAYAALEWAAARVPLPIAVGGDSAGGNLAAAVALRAREHSGPKISGQILFYPVTDHDFETPSYRENGGLGYSITTRDMAWFWDHYAGADQRAHPFASPLRAEDFSRLPPAFVVVAGYDPLRDEGVAYAERLGAARVPVALKHYPSMIHGFATMIGPVKQAEEVLRDAGAWTAALVTRK
ncbi:MAG TPA: alpha/beta hydrolase [Caulobacterales bacterium]|nr:alpha/beta hydrolase [Caulobacterales bacterium]